MIRHFSTLIKKLMKRPLKEGLLAENAMGIGTVTREMVRRRAAELAIINGRPAHEVSKSDWDEAKRELAGEPELDPKEAVSESERWDPVPGTTGHKAPEAGSEDEDDDGRSDSARLVEEGVSEAEHDQMLEAAKEGQQQDD